MLLQIGVLGAAVPKPDAFCGVLKEQSMVSAPWHCIQCQGALTIAPANSA